MKESEFLKIWLWNEHRSDVQWRRVRLGVVPDKQFARMYMVTLRWADAIVLKDGKVLIVEAKLNAAPGAIGQLELYKELFLQTPEFSAYKNWPIELVFLTPAVDLALVELCSKKGIVYEHYSLEKASKMEFGPEPQGNNP